jgi:hypothetical protein
VRTAAGALLPAVVLLLRSGAVAAAAGGGALPPAATPLPPPGAPAVNWAAASLGATATANSAGYWVRPAPHATHAAPAARRAQTAGQC